MKIVFMGTPEFATISLKALVEAGHEIVIVITQPDKPRGRGHKLMPSPVKEYATSQGIVVFQPEKLRNDDEAYAILSKQKADLFVVVAYGQILPQTILDIPKYGCINVHASLLPKYRGAAPIQWSILNGEETTGITTMFMDKGLDTGDMILKKEIMIVKSDTAETLHDKLAILGAETLLETIELIENGNVSREKQDDALSCYAPMINKQTAQIDFSKSAIEIFNLVRGMNSYPMAQTKYNGEPMKVVSCIVKSENFTGKNGEILSVSNEGVLVKCGVGSILIKEIQMAGKRRMTVSEYIKGNTFTVGNILKSE